MIKNPRELARLWLKQHEDIGHAEYHVGASFVYEVLTGLLATVPEASSIPCARCGGPCVEFTVPNDVWNAVVRLGGKEGDDEYICEECYRKAVTVYVRTTR